MFTLDPSFIGKVWPLFMWAVTIPAAFIFSRITALSPEMVFFLVTGTELIKCLIGLHFLRKGTWVQNIVSSGY